MQITDTDISSANANITAATQIAHRDTSFANANITTVTQITHRHTSSRDTSTANANITAATQIAHTDTSSANANINAATHITHFTHTDTSSANATSQLDTLSGPPQMHSPLRRALRRTRRRLRTVANGWQHGATFSEHSLTPRPPKWNGNPRYAFGKNIIWCGASLYDLIGL